MPAFTYEVLDAQGQTRRGTIEADNARAARSQLRAQALVPMLVEPINTAGAGATASTGGWFQRRVFNGPALMVWTRQLSGLVNSGLPVERGEKWLATLWLRQRSCRAF